MKPLISSNLEVALVLIAYAATCLVIMSVLFRKEWKTIRTLSKES